MSEISDNGNESWWQETFQIEMVNPDTLERTSILNLKRWKLISAVVCVVFLIVLLTYALMGFTPMRKLLPEDYSGLDVSEIVQLRSKVEDMERVLGEQDIYISSLKGLISGEPIDSLQHDESNSTIHADTQIEPIGISEEELQLRETMEMEDRLRSLRQNIRVNSVVENEKRQVGSLMAPVIGPIGKGYDPSVSHFGIDILAPENTAVKSIADGLVLQSDWTVETGNSIMILHSNGVISVYKHNSSLLKSNYEKVTQGEAVAIIGNTGTLTTGPHVHFELWIDGFPVDPATYINFQ